MQVWEVKLSLIIDSNEDWTLKFSVIHYKKKFNLINRVFVEETMNWSCDYIPSEMVVERHYSCYYVRQGFDHKLTDLELQNVQDKMRQFLIERLIAERNNFLLDFETKMNLLVVI